MEYHLSQALSNKATLEQRRSAIAHLLASLKQNPSNQDQLKAAYEKERNKNQLKNSFNDFLKQLKHFDSSPHIRKSSRTPGPDQLVERSKSFMLAQKMILSMWVKKGTNLILKRMSYQRPLTKLQDLLNRKSMMMMKFLFELHKNFGTKMRGLKLLFNIERKVKREAFKLIQMQPMRFKDVNNCQLSKLFAYNLKRILNDDFLRKAFQKIRLYSNPRKQDTPQSLVYLRGSGICIALQLIFKMVIRKQLQHGFNLIKTVQKKRLERNTFSQANKLFIMLLVRNTRSMFARWYNNSFLQTTQERKDILKIKGSRILRMFIKPPQSFMSSWFYRWRIRSSQNFLKEFLDRPILYQSLNPWTFLYRVIHIIRKKPAKAKSKKRGEFALISLTSMYLKKIAQGFSPIRINRLQNITQPIVVLLHLCQKVHFRKAARLFIYHLSNSKPKQFHSLHKFAHLLTQSILKLSKDAYTQICLASAEHRLTHCQQQICYQKIRQLWSVLNQRHHSLYKIIRILSWLLTVQSKIRSFTWCRIKGTSRSRESDKSRLKKCLKTCHLINLRVGFGKIHSKSMQGDLGKLQICQRLMDGQDKLHIFSKISYQCPFNSMKLCWITVDLGCYQLNSFIESRIQQARRAFWLKACVQKEVGLNKIMRLSSLIKTFLLRKGMSVLLIMPKRTKLLCHAIDSIISKHKLQGMRFLKQYQCSCLTGFFRILGGWWALQKQSLAIYALRLMKQFHKIRQYASGLQKGLLFKVKGHAFQKMRRIGIVV